MTRKATLLAAILLAGATLVQAFAADTPAPKDAPDLTRVRGLITAANYAGAIRDLDGMVTSGVKHADVYNLLGFAQRKSGDRKSAEISYQKALELDADHKGALEYQGELFVLLGQVDMAKANLAKLVKLCPSGCEERADLEKAIAAGPPKS